MGKHYSVSEKGKKAMRSGEMKYLRDTKGKYHMTAKDRKHMSEGMKRAEDHKYNHRDDMGRQPLGTEHSGTSHASDSGKEANRKAADSFKRV